jgi:DNA topoisomerase-1
LQQEASRKLGMAPARTMQLAQRLYEGADIGGETVGLITYMRTDGVDMAPEAVAATRRTIGREFGENYVPKAPRRYTAKAKNAQEAHEAIRPTDIGRSPREVARALDPEQARLYELIWTRTMASQMESAEMERTTVDILAEVGGRRLELRATGQVVLFDGFLKLYQEGKDDEEDEDGKRLPPMKAGDALTKKNIAATQQFTEPPPRFSEASLVKRMEELGIGRPSTYAAILQTLKDREYVRIEKKRLVAEDKGLIVTSFLESFFSRYVEFDFTAGLEEQLDRISNAEVDWKTVLDAFWREFTAALAGAKELRMADVVKTLDEELGDHVFQKKADGTDPRRCTSCGGGTLSLKLGKFGAFVGCSNYPECRYTRPLASTAGESAPGENGEGGQPGVRKLGTDPASGLEVTLRDGRYGAYVQLGEGDKPKRQTLPKTLPAAAVDLDRALKLLALPREVAKHPESGEPILAGICKYWPYVQHGRTFANLERGDDVLEIGANRAIDLIVAREGGGRGASAATQPGRALGEHPEGGAVTVRPGRYGPYVNWSKVNATLPKGMTPESITFEQAMDLVRAKQASGPAKGKGKPLRRAKGKARGKS